MPTPSAELSPDALMALAAQGHPEAMVGLVRRYEKRLRGFCRMMLKDAAAADDAAQEIFTTLWNMRHRFQSQGRFDELLFTLARNHCRGQLRRRAVVEFFGLAPTADAEPADAFELEAALDDARKQALLTSALSRLPEKFRVPLTLRFVEGFGYDEVARIIGRTESAARSRIFYGLQQLSKLIPPEVLS